MESRLLPRALNTTAVAALCCLALFVGANTAPAAFPGYNGRIAFESNRDGNSEIYSIGTDGSNSIHRAVRHLRNSRERELRRRPHRRRFAVHPALRSATACEPAGKLSRGWDVERSTP